MRNKSNEIISIVTYITYNTSLRNWNTFISHIQELHKFYNTKRLYLKWKINKTSMQKTESIFFKWNIINRFFY